MKLKTIALAGTLSAISTLAISQARETTLTVGKDKINAVKLEVNAPVKEVQAALQQKLATNGAMEKKGLAKGIAFNDVLLPAISTDTVDVWTRVQKNGNNSLIYMAVQDQQGNYLTGNETGGNSTGMTNTDSNSTRSSTASGVSGDGTTVEKVKAFLYDFARAQNYSSRDLEIGSLMDSVQTDQSGMDKYTAERAKIDSQVKELTSQLQTMEQSFNSNKRDMDRRKERLEDLKNGSETGEVIKGANDATKKKSKATKSSTGTDGVKIDNRPNGGN